uniref:Inosine/uridine-preferring nucleoside hydrolase domain-containing protein n=1 Tax=Chromera velia CCMP2878 TaxID=1169474 RepID=A0A0G4GBY9_9ALVE|eukprot:Cvel_21211.t1-p1 / transcript=Cvel_21211.t1 / gene=Cvel_21211 / organism=Chromera_velia_CCMP2878 / gene_product=hypothetical protein / transcript_product=hypothetical protein / location=Cvel_scaffold1970:774-7985(-) / protein_length=707 / sequence_SO=supercontig / SO=protein_coding / is_pseudo=false
MWSRRSLPLFVSALLCAGRGEERDQVESPSVPPPFGGGRVPVVVDTDIGQDVDDSWALSYLFALQDVFELSLVVTSSRCTTGKALLTERFIERSLNRKGTEEEGTGERGIPVVSGQATSPPLDFEQYGGPCCNGTLTCETDTLEACRSGFFVGPLWGWMEGEGEGEGGVASEDFVSAMLRAFDQGTRLVLALGPLTNLAAFQERHPETARQMTVVIMGGSIYTGYGGGPPSAEYNIRSDVQSAQRVFTEGGWKEILLAPLDSTQDIVLEGDLYGVLRETASAGTSAIASTLMEHYDYWFSRGCARVPKWCPGRDAEGSPFSPELKSSRLFDVGAVELLLAFVESRVESTFRIETIRVEVSEEGLTRVVETGGQEEGGKEGGDETQEEEEDKSNNSPSAARFPWSVGPKGRQPKTRGQTRSPSPVNDKLSKANTSGNVPVERDWKRCLRSFIALVADEEAQIEAYRIKLCGQESFDPLQHFFALDKGDKGFLSDGLTSLCVTYDATCVCPALPEEEALAAVLTAEILTERRIETKREELMEILGGAAQIWKAFDFLDCRFDRRRDHEGRRPRDRRVTLTDFARAILPLEEDPQEAARKADERATVKKERKAAKFEECKTHEGMRRQQYSDIPLKPQKQTAGEEESSPSYSQDFSPSSPSSTKRPQKGATGKATDGKGRGMETENFRDDSPLSTRVVSLFDPYMVFFPF